MDGKVSGGKIMMEDIATFKNEAANVFIIGDIGNNERTKAKLMFIASKNGRFPASDKNSRRKIAATNRLKRLQ